MYVYIIYKYDSSKGMYVIGGVHRSYASAHNWLMGEGYQYDDMDKMFWKDGDECIIEKHEVVCCNGYPGANEWVDAW